LYEQVNSSSSTSKQEKRLCLETYDVYITEVGTPNIMRFPSQKPITAVLGPHDIILLFDNDS